MEKYNLNLNLESIEGVDKAVYIGLERLIKGIYKRASEPPKYEAVTDIPVKYKDLIEISKNYKTKEKFLKEINNYIKRKNNFTIIRLKNKKYLKRLDIILKKEAEKDLRKIKLIGNIMYLSIIVRK